MEIRVNETILIPATELHWSFSKSSAPGGQGVNTTDSRVRLGWNVFETNALPEDLKNRAIQNLQEKADRDGDVNVVVESERSQLQNRLVALDRMRDLILEAIEEPPAPRIETKPSRHAKDERIADKKHHSEIKRNRRADYDDEQ